MARILRGASYWAQPPGAAEALNQPPRWLDTRGSFLTPSEGWITVLLLLAMNLVVIFTVQNSHWVSPMPRLWLVAILALLVSLAASKYRGPILFQVIVHAVSLAFGFGVVLTETATTLSGSAGDKFTELFTRLDSWFSVLSSQGISNDKLPFVFILCASTWLIMYLSTLFTFRIRWAWVAVIPPAYGLMTNQTYLPTETYPLPLLFFLLFAILFMGRTYFLRRSRDWKVHALDQRQTRKFTFLANAVLLTAVVLTVAWVLPAKKIVLTPLKDTYTTARGPWQGLEGDFERVFAGVPSKTAGPLHSFGAALPLRGAVSLGATEVLTVTTEFPFYWRAQTYDFYEGRGWIATQGQRQSVKIANVPAPSDTDAYKKRETIAQQVNLKAESTVLFAGGQPIQVNIPTDADVAIPKTYEISLRGPQTGDLPPDLADAATKIVNSRGSLAEIQALIPTGTRVVEEKRGSLVVTRDSPKVADILGLKAPGRVKPGTTYEVLSSVSIATVEDLLGERGAYPKWVTDNYLQLPPAMPDRVRALGKEIAKSAKTPYEKAAAVEAYLRDFRETFNIEPPPLNVDAVDYFLFVQKAGYSDYFGSAMTVLLRAGGVPARLAAGYASGVFNPQTSQFTVRLSDAHSWPEVYFPTYGWIVFEPSPSLKPIPRGPLEEANSIELNGAGANLEDTFNDFPFPEDPTLNDAIRPLEDLGGGQLFTDIATKAGLALGSLLALGAAVFLLFFALWQVNFLGLPYAPGIYSRMTRLGAIAWRGPRRTETPAEYASALASELALRPGQAGAVADGFVKARYGGRDLSSDDRERVQRAWRGIRSSLVRRLLRRANLFELLKRDG